jgi:alkanesulfonate monooxygenase SsuD/methylene tetrahydromethanopterin reductase-like flavin-dependent oxidoreductase (luciferase family)
VKIGLMIPMGIRDGQPPMSWPEIKTLAERAEASGLDSLWVEDQLLIREHDEPESGLHECWTMVSALAAATEHVELGTFVSATAFRPAGMVAKMAAAVDEVSGGRLILGLGCGWHEPEFRAFGYPYDHRVGRFEEAVRIIAPLVRGERVTFAGQWMQADDAVLLPAPRRPIPIMIASKGPRMHRLAARHADSWNAAFYGFPGQLWANRRSEILAACEEEDRDPATLGLTVGLTVDGSIEVDRRPASAIPADQAALTDALALWQEEGVTHVQLGLDGGDDVYDLVLDTVSARRAAQAPVTA